MVVTTLQLGPHRVRVSDCGPEQGTPPLLLVNGLGANLELWQPLRSRLSRRTLAFDLPGTGESSTPLLPMTIEDDARFALQVLDAFGVGAADVLGFSFGGCVAQELARLAPDRVRRLVLASASCGWGGLPGNPLALALVSHPLRYYSPTFFKPAAPVLVGGRGARSRAFLEGQARRRAARPPSPVGYWYQLYAAATWSSCAWLHTLRQPTLLVTGCRDQVVPAANSWLMAGLLPNARVRTWPEGGHLLLLDSPSSVVPEIEEFLEA